MTEASSEVHLDEKEHANAPHKACCSCHSSLCKCIRRIPHTWPRTFHICCGVILPLWGLIFVSLLLGSGLARLEAQGEYEANDEWMAARAQTYKAVASLGNVSVVLPRLCAEIFLSENMTLDDLEDLLLELVSKEVILPSMNVSSTNGTLPQNETINATQPQSETVAVNTTEMLTFMEDCGVYVQNITQQRFMHAMSDVLAQTIAKMSFNWIRCTSQNTQFSLNPLIFGSGVNVSVFLPEEQEAFYATAWEASFQIIFDAYFVKFTQQQQQPPGMAATDALDLATELATGRGNCTVNTQAGGWFWFSIMSTVGFGNQAPVTWGGRAMVFTCGFFSIVAFAIIVGTSGFIITSIFDDTLRRWKVADRLRTPFLESLLWGFLYYSWMLFIAGYTKFWKNSRLGENFDYGDAYWFSYISTTTVGLGDSYLEPEVLQNDDLLIFSLLLLFGFVLLATFLVKFIELLRSFLPEKERTLKQRLENTNMIFCSPVKQRETTNNAVHERSTSNEFKSKYNEKDEEEGSDTWYDANETTDNVGVEAR